MYGAGCPMSADQPGVDTMRAVMNRPGDHQHEFSLAQLDREERMRLMRFVCSFAWADLEIQQEERSLIGGLITRLELDRHEQQQIREWLEVPPATEDIDPTRVPKEHRELFRRAIEATIASDGRVTPEECATLQLFDRLVDDR